MNSLHTEIVVDSGDCENSTTNPSLILKALNDRDLLLDEAKKKAPKKIL